MFPQHFRLLPKLLQIMSCAVNSIPLIIYLVVRLIKVDNIALEFKCPPVKAWVSAKYTNEKKKSISFYFINIVTQLQRLWGRPGNVKIILQI